jgi:hypothetical protein
MIGRRAAVGLLPLCVLAFCAISAPSAIAVGTTAFTCVPVAAGTGDFTDAHCNSAGKGDFKSEEVKEGVKTSTEGTNEKTKGLTTEPTPMKLETTVGVVKVVIECSKATTLSTNWTNEKNGEKQMLAKTQATVFTFSGCTVPKPVNKNGEEACQIKKAILLGGVVITEVDEKGMYVNFRESGAELGTITIENKSECPAELTNNPLAVKGTAAADANGATLAFPSTVAGTSSVKIAGGAATLSATMTIRKEKEAGKEQNPLFLKTTSE